MDSTEPSDDVIVYETALIGIVGTLTFLKPLPILFEVAPGRATIADEVFMCYGAGATKGEALNSYLADLAKQFIMLEQSAAKYPEDFRLLQAMRDTFVFRADPWQTE